METKLIMYYYRIYDGQTEPYIVAYHVISHTLRGVWINDGRARFIKDGTRKKFACPTIEQALESYIARKKRHYKILKAQLDKVERNLLWSEQENFLSSLKNSLPQLNLENEL